MGQASAVCVALDVPEEGTAAALARRLAPYGVCFKIGLQGFCHFGPSGVQRLQEITGPVLLDLKLHDIPNTVASAVQAISALGVWGVTMHACGGPSMLQAAVEAARGRVKTLAVTVLTSTDAPTLSLLGGGLPLEQQVERLAEVAWQAGCDGLVASAQEASALRARLGPGPIVVTPGIRPLGTTSNDQARFATPAAALAAGADLLVVGRPIYAAADPEAALAAILAEMAASAPADHRGSNR